MRKWLSLILAFALCMLPLYARAEEETPKSLPTESTPEILEKNAPLKLLSTLYTGQKTLVYSPLSLSVALAMAAEGACGETKAQLDAFLSERRPELMFLEDLSFSGVKLANTAFYRPELKLLDSYQDVLQDQYDAEAVKMEEGSVAPQVNEWVSNHTDGMISQMLDEEPDAATMMILINALSMKAYWELPFDGNHTGAAEFHAPDGDIEVSMMHQTEFFRYAEVDGVQAISLPYADSTLQMTVLLPRESNLSELVEQISEAPDAFLNRYLPDEFMNVHLSLPNVRAESSFDLISALSEAGVTDALDASKADFSAMAENAQDMGLYIGRVLQKTMLNVNETGTEAAAATAVIMRAKGAVAAQSVEMNVNQPFMLLVHDRESGYVLFAACINNPS